LYIQTNYHTTLGETNYPDVSNLFMALSHLNLRPVYGSGKEGSWPGPS